MPEQPISVIDDWLKGVPTPGEIATPEFDPQISGSGADPTHHIKLEDGEGFSVGFVITDQAGDRDERTFRRFPSADPQNPYVTEKQSSFGGGFGQAVFEENRAKYWRANGIDTTKDALVLAPMFHFAKGAHSKAEEYMPQSSHNMNWLRLNGSFRFLAQPVTPSIAWSSVTYLKLWLEKQDSPEDLLIKTYTNSAGEPNTLINTTTVTAAEITHTDGQWVRIAVPDTYGFSTNQFWLVLTSATTGSGFWAVLGHEGSGGLKSVDGGSWSAGPEFYFRLEGARAHATHNFYEYKKQLYWLAMYDAYGASEMWMNGWRGVADSNSADKTDLRDATQNWAGKITGDEVVQMYAGPASSEQDDRRGVTGGFNQYLEVSPDWEITHTNQDEYVVTNSDYCFQIADDSTLGGRVTDMATANGAMYICKGNSRYMLFYEGYRNESGVWDQRWRTVYAKAQFVQSVNDPVFGDILWFGHNRVVDGAYKPYVWYSQPVDYESYSLDRVDMSVNSGQGTSWVAAGGAQVSIANIRAGTVKIMVALGEVTGVTINAAGEDYAEGDKLILSSTGTKDAYVTVTGIGGSGEVTTISAIVEAGEDYDTGAGQATTTDGGGNGACTLDIDTVSTFQGDIAYLDMKDSDGAAVTFDLRNMTQVFVNLSYSTKRGGENKLAAGEMKLKLSNQTALGNVISTVSLQGIAAGDPGTLRNAKATLALSTIAGADSIASLGLNLQQGHSLDRSFQFVISGQWSATRARAPIEVGLVDGDNITGLQAYGDPETAWVLTESSFGGIKNNKFMPIPMREIKTARHANNGKANEVSDVYLLFSWKGRLQRYYRQNMEDLGPDFPQGMADIKGDIVDVVTYPGRIYVAVDGGVDNSSLLLCYKGGAWHQVYTSFTGERIRKLFIQPIEGHPDKLWASVGADVMWFPIILDATELPANSGYQYRPTGHLDTSWIYTEDRDLNKVFRSLWVTLDKAVDPDLQINIYYKVDNEDDDWAWIEDVADMSYSTKKFRMVQSNSPEARGNRIKFRIALKTRDVGKSHILRSMTTRMYRLPEIKYIYSWLSKVSTISINLRGDEERSIGTQASADAALLKLDTWAANLTILKVISDIASVNGRSVVIEPVPFQLLMMVHDERIQEESIQMSANEID